MRKFLVGALAVVALAALPALAQHSHDHGAPSSTPAKPADGATRGAQISMEELHRAGGVPPGWRFTWPDGDASKGRQAFVKFECYQCHEVRGESFPPAPPDPTRRGPALSGMGGHHPAEYFAESIVNPNAVIVTGPGHTGADGRTIMPDYRDSLTLAETIDLVAYIRSLTGGEHAQHGGAPAAARERVVGDYRVRIAYAAPGAAGGGQHDQHQHHHGSGTSAPAAHLMVFVSDVTLGEPLPYLPVTATIHADKAAPRVVRMNPMLGGKGFHYGANVTLPDATRKITVVIGKPTLQVMPAAAARFGRAEVSFEWGN
jgi:mono/diheme cytochrome c family protein